MVWHEAAVHVLSMLEYFQACFSYSNNILAYLHRILLMNIPSFCAPESWGCKRLCRSFCASVHVVCSLGAELGVELWHSCGASCLSGERCLSCSAGSCTILQPHSSAGSSGVSIFWSPQVIYFLKSHITSLSLEWCLAYCSQGDSHSRTIAF